MTNSSTAVIFRQAAERAEKHWIQNHFRDDKGGECLVMCVLSAAGVSGNTLPIQLLTPLYNYVSTLPSFAADPNDGRQDQVIYWNDVPGRRRKEVVRALIGTAEAIEARQRARQCRRARINAPRATQRVVTAERRELLTV